MSRYALRVEQEWEMTQLRKTSSKSIFIGKFRPGNHISLICTEIDVTFTTLNDLIFIYFILF